MARQTKEKKQFKLEKARLELSCEQMEEKYLMNAARVYHLRSSNS